MNRVKKAVGAALVATLLSSSCSSMVLASTNLVSGDSVSTKLASSTSITTNSGQIKKEVIKVQSTVDDVRSSESTPMVEKYLLSGHLKEGDLALAAHLIKQPSDDQARFGLGVLQFLRALEELGQALTRYGVRTHEERGFVLPFMRIPAATNYNCKKIDYFKAREIVESFQKQVLLAEATLSLVTDGEVKLPLHFGLIKLDFNGTSVSAKSSDEADDGRSLWKLYAKLTNNTNIPQAKAEQFFIKFDRGDVHWLRGYCHVLATICDVYLAHDSKALFDHTGHLFFNKVDSPYQFLNKGKHIRTIGGADLEILDLIAALHLLSCDVIEPARMASALNHMQAVVDQSRDTWKWIMAETDDDHEWLPNPRQTGVIPNVSVTDEMVVAWSEIMNESERILKGELLIPFWRASETDQRGINLRKVFLEPRKFDLVLWAQGSSAVPYLEKGKLTKGQTWRDLRSVFGHNFPGFALWFN